MPLLPADFVHARDCKLKCEKFLTLPTPQRLVEEIEAASAEKKSRRAAIEAFLDTLAQADLMEKFDSILWCGLVDYVTVHSKVDVRTFKNRQEVRA